MQLEPIFLQATEDTPKVVLDADTGVFELIGRLLPEDSAEFFAPLFEWLKKYKKNPKKKTIVKSHIWYYNSASSRFHIYFLEFFEQIEGAEIYFYHHEDDEDIKYCAEEFGEIIEVPFTIKMLDENGY